MLIWGAALLCRLSALWCGRLVDIGDLTLSNYDIGLVVLAAALAACGYWALNTPATAVCLRW